MYGHFREGDLCWQWPLRKGPLYTMCIILHFYLNIHVHANALYKFNLHVPVHVNLFTSASGCTLLCMMCIYIAWQVVPIYNMHTTRHVSV